MPARSCARAGRVAGIESEVCDTLEELDGEGDSPLPSWDNLLTWTVRSFSETVAILEKAEQELERAEEHCEILERLEAAHAEHRVVRSEVREARERCAEAELGARASLRRARGPLGGEDLEAWEIELREEEETLTRARSQPGRAALPTSVRPRTWTGPVRP